MEGFLFKINILHRHKSHTDSSAKGECDMEQDHEGEKSHQVGKRFLTNLTAVPLVVTAGHE